MPDRTLSQMEVHPDLYRPSAAFVHRIRSCIRNAGVMITPDPTHDGSTYSWYGYATLVVHSAVYREVFKGWM